MKIYLQTEVQAAETPVTEPRPRVALLETGADGAAVQQALETIAARLGAIVAIPPAAHEANLGKLLARDLAEAGIAPGASEGGEAVLKVVRTPKGDAPPGQAEVWTLRYEVLRR